jgi:hypothetical protein
MDVRPATDEDRAALEPLWLQRWGSLRMVSRGRLHELLSYPTLAAHHEGELVGALAYDVRDDELITTNDNTHALRFYQRRGLQLAALHRNAIEESRRLKPEIPQHGADGIPLRDELELELVLDCKT